MITFKKIIVPIVDTLGKVHLPYVDKRFNLDHYSMVKNILDGHEYAIGLVSTSGHFSNLMIKAANIFCKDKRKFKTKRTHSFIICNGRVIEATSKGLRECSLLKAIGQRDYVTIRIPNESFIPKVVQEGACFYLEKRIEEDSVKNISYDVEHDITNDRKLDCSESIYASLKFGYERVGQKEKITEVERFGILTWTPADAEFSKLFKTVYEN